MSPAESGRGKDIANGQPGPHQATRGGPGPPVARPKSASSEPPSGGSPAGRRQARLAIARRRRRATLIATVAAIALVVVTGAVLIPLLARGDGQTTSAAPSPRPPPPVSEQTLLLVRYDDPRGPATGATLLSVRHDGEPSAALFIPIGLLVDVPGIGLDRVALAHQYGGPELFETTIESALRIVVDDTAAVSGQELASLLSQAGPLTIEADQRLVAVGDDGEEQVIAEEGEQTLEGDRLAAYWAYVSDSDSPLNLHRRQEKILRALFTSIAEDPERLDEFLEQDAAPLETDADLQELAAVLGGLAQAAAEQQLLFEQVPVRPFGGRETGPNALFRMAEDARSTVHALLPGSAVQGEEVQATRVHVQNGVGRPRISREIAEALEGGAFQIVLTDDADRSDHAETEIRVYQDTPEAMEVAEAVRQRLGVGTIQVSTQGRPSVDVTIIVGRDFLDTDASGANDTQASTTEQDT